MTTWIGGICEANGIRIHYLRTGGAKPPVVLLHGLMGSGACWAPLARALEGEFDVVMPDARGHGDSDLVAQARARHPHRSPEIVELQAEARRKTSIAAFDVLTPPNPAYRDVVSAIDVPTLLVIGDSSPVVTLEIATELRSLTPRVRTQRIERAGHGLPFERPERLAEVVVSFLRELG